MKCSLSVDSMCAALCAGSLLLGCSSNNGGVTFGSGGGPATGGFSSGYGGAGTSTGGVPFGAGGLAAGGGIGGVGNGGLGGVGNGGLGGVGNGGLGGGGLPGSGGVPASGGAAGAGGVPASGGSAGSPPGDAGMTANCTSSSPTGPTIFGSFPAADPSKNGPIAEEEDMNVGPGNAYTMFRPKDFSTNGPLFPVVTWGNGTGTTPDVYSFLLNRLASHGFIVIASNSMNVAQGNPPPMLDGVTWVFEQNCDPSSPLYQHVDTAHVGATGHSQGAFATMEAGQDPRIVATAPIEGSLPAQLHGPSLLLCGGMDTTVGCMGAQSAFSAIQGQPLMYAELLAASHTSWIQDSITAEFTGGDMSPFVTAVVAWMRVFLMGDASQKPMFYGSDCTLCKDTADWTVQQKMLN